MDHKICKTVLEHRQQLVPALFTERQVNIVQKYLQQEQLTPGEQTYFYSAIRRKMEALRSLREEYYITGENMLPERVEQAQQILQKLKHEKAFVSGSFLYKKEYNDLDIFIIGNRRKSYRIGNTHFTVIVETDLARPIFVSAAKYSVATFPAVIKASPQRGGLGEILFTYQWVINQILEKEDQKEIRDLVFQHALHVKKEIFDSRSLDLQVQEIKNLAPQARINKINQITKEILVKIYSAKYIYNAVSNFTKTVKEMGKEYKTDNIPIFLHFAKGVQYECRRTQT